MATEPEFFAKHHVEFSLEVERFTVMMVQFGTDCSKGILRPVIKLLNLTNSKDLCLEHRQDPVNTFVSDVAARKAKDRYENIEEYQGIWKKILNLEAATNAGLSDGMITIDNVPVRLFKRNEIYYGELRLKKSSAKSDILRYTASQMKKSKKLTILSVSDTILVSKHNNRIRVVFGLDMPQ
jgi:hypothetical protein